MLLKLSKKRELVQWLTIFVFLTLLGLLNFNRFTTSELAEGRPPNYPHHFVNEMTGVYTIMLILPFLLHFFRKFPLKKNNLLQRLPLYLIASAGFGASHTLLMYFSRQIIYQAAFGTPYNYGQLPYRFLMEYSHQFYVFWLIYGVAYFITKRGEANQQKVRAAELERELAQTRLQALQMQINPHFLFNTLNMVSSTMHENVETADKMLANLSELLRKTLNYSKWTEHSLKKELELADLYVKLMKARFGAKLAVEHNIAQDAAEALTPGFILQPLIENSIRHGMENLKRVTVKISAQRKNGRLLLSVKDDGAGLHTDVSDAAPRNGVGLSNTIERLENLYGEDQQFQLLNGENGGCEVRIETPFRTEPREEKRGA